MEYNRWRVHPHSLWLQNISSYKHGLYHFRVGCKRCEKYRWEKHPQQPHVPFRLPVRQRSTAAAAAASSAAHPPPPPHPSHSHLTSHSHPISNNKVGELRSPVDQTITSYLSVSIFLTWWLDSTKASQNWFPKTHDWSQKFKRTPHAEYNESWSTNLQRIA